MRGDNRINSDDETISQKGLFYGAKSGVQHNIPISTNFKIAKHFNFSLGGNYSEVWTNQTIRKFDYDLLSDLCRLKIQLTADRQNITIVLR